MTDRSQPEVVLYTRTGCHLCEDAKQVLLDAGVTFTAVDIDSDIELQRQYHEQIPALFIAGRKAFKYRIDPVELRRKMDLARRGSAQE